VKTTTGAATHEELLAQMARVGREHRDATVLFHSTMAGLLGLHPTDYKTLGILDRLGPLSAGEIASHSGLATASVTNLLDRLESKGFVRRVADPDDGRRLRVEPIRERLAGARKKFAGAVRSLAALVGSYDDHELAVIVDFLGRNAERLRRETAKLEDATRRHPRRRNLNPPRFPKEQS